MCDWCNPVDLLRSPSLADYVELLRAVLEAVPSDEASERRSGSPVTRPPWPARTSPATPGTVDRCGSGQSAGPDGASTR